MNLSDRTRKLLKWIGYPLFGFFSFLIFLYLTFPYDKLKGRLESYLAATADLDVTIGELGPSPLFGLSAQKVTVVMRPQPGAPAAKPVRLAFDEVTVKAGIFALLTGGIDVRFAARGLGGELEGSYELKKKDWSAKLEVSKIDLGKLGLLGDAIGLPVGGSLSAKLELSVPQDRYSNANGSIELDGDALTVGDGKAMIKVPGNPLLALGVTLPRTRLGKLAGQIKIEKGTATLENVSAQSPDVELALEGRVNLRNPLPYSEAQAYLRFKLSPELKKREPKFELVENGLANAKRSDGFYGAVISGVLKRLGFVPSAVGPNREGPGGRPGMPGMQRPGGFRSFPASGSLPSAAPHPRS